MFRTVTRWVRTGRRRLGWRRLRRRLERIGVTPVVLRRRAWQLEAARAGDRELELIYRGPGGSWRLGLPYPGRASALDAAAPGLTPVTVVFPDGCTVRCVGDTSDRFVPIPPHSDSVAALLPPMAHVSTDQLVSILSAADVGLEPPPSAEHGRHRRNHPRTHAA